jgi:hypothetical protein
MIDDDALKRLLRIDDELTKLCKWLNEQRDTTVSVGSFRLWMILLTFCYKQVKTTTC